MELEKNLETEAASLFLTCIGCMLTGKNSLSLEYAKIILLFVEYQQS